MCLHIGQGFNAITTPPEAPIDNLIILATQVSALAAQDLLWGRRVRTSTPTSRSRGPKAGIGWIPFYLDRCDRHYTNQRWLGHDFGDKMPSDIFREHSLACYVTDPVVAQGASTTSASTSSPGSATTRTPTRSGPTRRRSSSPSSTTPALSDADIHQITLGERRAGTSATTRSSTSRARTRPSAQLRALSPDVDTSTCSRAEWRQRYEASAAV